MATPLKIDPIKLNELLNEGKKTKEIAEIFKCSPGAVSQAKRRLAVAVTMATATKRRDAATKAAPLIINNAEDAKRQLSNLICRCNDELAWIQDSVKQEAVGDYRAWQETAIKHVAEARKLISAMADIEYKLHHVSVVEKALLIMFEEIGNESKDCQKRIRDRLERSQILFFLDD
jgi:predicted transcriptional regulator